MNIFSFSPFGYEGALVSVEVDLRRGIPAVDIVGLADSAVKESRERMRAAIRNCGLNFPQERVLINLSPADLKKEGAGFDLPIALAVLGASATCTGTSTSAPSTNLPTNDDMANELLANLSVLVMGELDLAGNVRPVRGVHAAVATAKEHGITHCIVPKQNVPEASVSGMYLYGASTVADAFNALKRDALQSAFSLQKDTFAQSKEFVSHGIAFPPLDANCDFKTVKNCGVLVRALQIAAAGRHNLLVFGSPGCGKTLALQRFTSILPCLSREESATVTRIYSLAGLIEPGGSQLKVRPFRMPHQSASIEGMMGGGLGCRPGEVSLAHNGVLFLDEAAEFRTSVLQMLRVPLETGSITLSRAGRCTTYPSDFQLLLATNPCACGNFGSKEKVCLCSARSVEQYWKKFSAPLLDRIDLRVSLVDNEPFASEINSSAQNNFAKDFSYYNEISSAKLRAPIALAVHQQMRRQQKWNANLSAEECASYIKLCDKVEEALQKAMMLHNFSMRAEACVRKLARTIADLEGSEEIAIHHLEEAVFFRRNSGGLDLWF